MVNADIRLIIFFAAKDGEALYNQQKQDHEHLIAKFRLKLKRVGKTTRPFRYDLNQIPMALKHIVQSSLKVQDGVSFFFKMESAQPVPFLPHSPPS